MCFWFSLPAFCSCIVCLVVSSLVSSVWQEIGWVECLTEISYFCVEWGVKPELGQTYLLAVAEGGMPACWRGTDSSTVDSVCSGRECFVSDCSTHHVLSAGKMTVQFLLCLLYRCHKQCHRVSSLEDEEGE